MPAPVPISAGTQFHLLTVLGPSARQVYGQRHFRCKCVCGAEVDVAGRALRSGHTRSCGCLARDPVVRKSQTHGFVGTPTYQSWCAMKARCLNPRNPNHPNYGGRGIKVCDRWLTFEHFLADMGARPAGTSLDRIDNNGHYEPGNCRWATRSEQQNNRRANHLVEIDGHLVTLTEAARKAGVPINTLRYRLRAAPTPRN